MRVSAIVLALLTALTLIGCSRGDDASLQRLEASIAELESDVAESITQLRIAHIRLDALAASVAELEAEAAALVPVLAELDLLLPALSLDPETGGIAAAAFIAQDAEGDTVASLDGSSEGGRLMLFLPDGSGFVSRRALIPAGARLWLGILPGESSTLFLQHPESPPIRLSAQCEGLFGPLRGSGDDEVPFGGITLWTGCGTDQDGEMFLWLNSGDTSIFASVNPNDARISIDDDEGTILLGR